MISDNTPEQRHQREQMQHQVASSMLNRCLEHAVISAPSEWLRHANDAEAAHGPTELTIVVAVIAADEIAGRNQRRLEH